MASLLKRGSFVCDATGVGKGRTIAGLIFEYLGCVRRRNARRCRLTLDSNRKHGASLRSLAECISCVVFQLCESVTYKELHLLQQWLTVETGGIPLIVLDECHLLRNEKCACFQVVNDLLNGQAARIVYSSATPVDATSRVSRAVHLIPWSRPSSHTQS